MKLRHYLISTLFFILLVIIVAGILLFSIRQKPSYPPHLVMGYWTYSQSYPIPGSLNKEGKTVSNQDMQDKLNYLNILAYAFLSVHPNGVVHFKNSHIDLGDQDFGFCKDHKESCIDNKGIYEAKLGNFRRFAQLSNQSKTLKKIISVGGADDNESFQYAIHHIPIFVDSAAAIINNYQLNGIDLDFEPAAFSPEDAQSYAALVAALRQKLGPQALITITISTNQNLSNDIWKSLATNASYISDMCYDFHSALFAPHYTGHNSNLYPDVNSPMIPDYEYLSCDQSIHVLTFHGVPPEKILLGYPSFAEVYNGVEEKNHGLFQRFDPQKKLFDADNLAVHEIAYKEIINLLNRGGFEEYSTSINKHVSAAWAYNPRIQQFLSYDNTEVIKEKVNYVNRNHLAGLMTWLINFDVPVTNSKSLLKAANTD